MKHDSFGETLSGAEAFRQAVRVGMRTQLGSVPLDPTFGVDWLAAIDRAVPEARAILVRELTRAWKQWYSAQAELTSIDSTETADGLSIVLYFSHPDGTSGSVAVLP